MGPASSLGKYVKHVATQAEIDLRFLRGDGYRDFVLRLMRKLKDGRLPLRRIRQETRTTTTFQCSGFRIEKILWRLGDGKTVRPDLIKRRSYKYQSPVPNAFFREIYRRDFTESKRLTAADHTGQLGVVARQDREDRFRADWYLDESKNALDESRDS